ncbi:MAG: hypothetical protein K8R67_01525 [Desulfobacteraceae bacterium]|nr:hypothetical protein [Desulfobacteraceae bacterium]
MIVQYRCENNKTKISKHILLCQSILLISLFLILSGCIQLAVRPATQGESALKAAEQTFLQVNYALAAERFKKVILDQNKNQKIKNSGIYGLACTKMMTAQNDDEFINAVALLNQWTSSKEEKMHFENPELLILAVSHMVYIKEQEKQKLLGQIGGLNTKVKKQNQESVEMQQLIKTLQHQISELENIDQELQEKRKAQ